MTLFPKKHPWIILVICVVIFYTIIISSWTAFIHLAGKRETNRLTSKEADELYKQRQEKLQEKQNH